LSPKDEKVLAKLIKAWKQAAELKREFGEASQAVRDRFIERILESASSEEDDTETELKPIQQDDQEMDGNDNDGLNDANDNDDDNDNDDEDMALPSRAGVAMMSLIFCEHSGQNNIPGSARTAWSGV
jgi:hypothetical protein